MTARDTHELRLNHWPLLSTFPTTNGFLVLVMLLWLATGGCALAHFPPHDRWYQSLEVLTGIVVLQFAAKRASHTDLWRRPK